MDERLICLIAAIKTAHLPVIDDAGYEVVRVDDILALPSVQLAQDLTKGCTDTISRKGVLSLLDAVPSEEFATKAMLISGVKALPSAQPVVISKSENTTECEDAVSRFAVLRLIDYSSHDLNDAVDNRYMQNEIKQLPSVTPKQPGWIPCTPETMPKMTDTYLVQVGINENGEGMHTEVRTADWNVVWHEWYVHTTRCFVGDIIKWMPIPWEGGQDNG